jgi:hypothetical protein
MLNEVKHLGQEREVGIASKGTGGGEVLRVRSEPALSMAEGMTFII